MSQETTRFFLSSPVYFPLSPFGDIVRYHQEEGRKHLGKMGRGSSSLATIPFQVLVTFEILETELRVVVDGVVVMHNLRVARQHWKDVIFQKALQALLHMSREIGNSLIPIEAEAGTLRIDEYDSKRTYLEL